MSFVPHRPLFALCLLACAAMLAGTARADDDDKRRGADRQAVRGDERLPRHRQQDALSDAVRRIERTTQGQVLSAERMQADGRDINRIKVVDDSGRVRVYMDDPQQQQRQRRGPPTRDDDD